MIYTNSVEIELPDHLKIHYVINVIHTALYNEQLSDKQTVMFRYLVLLKQSRGMGLL